MRKQIILMMVAIVLVAVSSVANVSAGPKAPVATFTLSGYQEVPSISTTGHGTFTATLGPGGTSINYELTYDDMEGAVSVAHIHFGQPGVNGGILAYLCGGGNKPVCPQSGTVSGSIVDADIQPILNQGVDGGMFTDLFNAILAGTAYANVHTDLFPNGAIRGRLIK